MTYTETTDLLRRLEGCRVMVTAVLHDGKSVSLFPSPASAEDALTAVTAVHNTALAGGFHVRRDESALGLLR